MPVDFQPEEGGKLDFQEEGAPAAKPGLLNRIGTTVGDTITGAAHGISSGDGWLSTLVKRGLLHEGELDELNAEYEKAKVRSPKTIKVSDFAGEMYTPENTVMGAAVGGALGAGAKALGGFAAKKVGQAVGDAAAKVAARANAEVASATGALGGEAQGMNRLQEWLIRLLGEEPSKALDPAKKAALEKLSQTPEYAETLGKAADRILTELPNKVGRVTTKEQQLAALKAALPAKVAQETEKAVSGGEAMRQVGARALRYGLPAIGGAVGVNVGGDEHAAEGGLAGLGIGALAGAGMRPMMHSLIRMGRNPAVRNQVWGAIEKAASGLGGSNAAPTVTGQVLASKAPSWLEQLGLGVGTAPTAATPTGSGEPTPPGDAGAAAPGDGTLVPAARRVLQRGHPAEAGANTGATQ